MKRISNIQTVAVGMVVGSVTVLLLYFFAEEKGGSSVSGSFGIEQSQESPNVKSASRTITQVVGKKAENQFGQEKYSDGISQHDEEKKRLKIEKISDLELQHIVAGDLEKLEQLLAISQPNSSEVATYDSLTAKLKLKLIVLFGKNPSLALASLRDFNFSEIDRPELYQLIGPMLDGNEVNLSERVPIYRSFDLYPDFGDNEVESRLIHMKLQDVIKESEGEIVLQLRQDSQRVQEIIEKIEGSLGDAYSSHPDTLNQIIRLVAEQNPISALEAINIYKSGQSVNESLINASKWAFYDTIPQKLYEFHELAKPMGVKEQQEFQTIWNDRSRRYFRRFDTAYLEWVDGLPPSSVQRMVANSVKNISR